MTNLSSYYSALNGTVLHAIGTTAGPSLNVAPAANTFYYYRVNSGPFIAYSPTGSVTVNPALIATITQLAGAFSSNSVTGHTCKRGSTGGIRNVHLLVGRRLRSIVPRILTDGDIQHVHIRPDGYDGELHIRIHRE